MLTWNNIEKLGGSTSWWGDLDTLTYRFINDRMHICAGNSNTDSCAVIIQPLCIIQCLMHSDRNDPNSFQALFNQIQR